MGSHIPAGAGGLPDGGKACPAGCAWAQRQCLGGSGGMGSGPGERGHVVHAARPVPLCTCWGHSAGPRARAADVGPTLVPMESAASCRLPPSHPRGCLLCSCCMSLAWATQCRAVSVGGRWRGPWGWWEHSPGVADIGSGLCFRRRDLDGLPPDREHHRVGRAGERQDHQALEE